MNDATKELLDIIGSIKNRCLIAEWILKESTATNVQEALPTLIEDNFGDCQILVDKYCVLPESNL